MKLYMRISLTVPFFQLQHQWVGSVVCCTAVSCRGASYCCLPVHRRADASTFGRGRGVCTILCLGHALPGLQRVSPAAGRGHRFRTALAGPLQDAAVAEGHISSWMVSPASAQLQVQALIGRLVKPLQVLVSGCCAAGALKRTATDL